MYLFAFILVSDMFHSHLHSYNFEFRPGIKYTIIQFCVYGLTFALYGIYKERREERFAGTLHFEIEEWEVYIRATKKGQREKAKVYVDTWVIWRMYGMFDKKLWL